MPEQLAEQELTWQQQRMLSDAVSSSERKLWKAYLIAIFLGGFGVHRFYLGRKWTAILMLVMNFVASIMIHEGTTQPENVPAEIAGSAILLALLLWIMIDLFLIPGMARKFNAGLEPELKKKLLKEWTA